MSKLTTTPIAHNIQKLRSLMMEQHNAINQIGERVDSVRDDASLLSTRSDNPATVTTQPITALQQKNQALQTTLTVSEARVT